jgi:hypothetical protein
MMPRPIRKCQKMSENLTGRRGRSRAGFWVPITFFASLYYMVVHQSKVAVVVFAFYLMQLVLPQGKVRNVMC